MKKKKPEVWQNHHVQYDPPILAVVRRSEHFYLTRLNRFKELSRGFRMAMVALMESKPIKEKE